MCVVCCLSVNWCLQFVVGWCVLRLCSLWVVRSLLFLVCCVLFAAVCDSLRGVLRVSLFVVCCMLCFVCCVVPVFFLRNSSM